MESNDRDFVTPLVFQLTQPPLLAERTDDSGGNWEYLGTTAIEQARGTTVQLVATRRTNSAGGVSFAGSMLTVSVIFPAAIGIALPNLTLAGVHDFATNNESGSVSAATADFSDYVGGTFIYNGSTFALTVNPPKL